jgi:hypothetical protein
LKDSPAIRGLINRVIHLVSFEETKDAHLPKREKVVTYRLGTVTAPKEPKRKPPEPKKAKAAPVPEAKKAPVKKKAVAKKATPTKKAHKK